MLVDGVQLAAWNPDTDASRPLAPDALELALDAAGERLVVRGWEDVRVVDVASSRVRWRQSIPPDAPHAKRVPRPKVPDELAAISPSGERVAFVRDGPDGKPRVEVWDVPR